MKFYAITNGLQLAWERLTLSRLTTAYFVFSVAHCIIQVALQATAFSINAQAASFIWDLAGQGKLFKSLVIPDLQEDSLRVCPSNILNDESLAVDCVVVWNAQLQNFPSGQFPTTAVASSSTAEVATATVTTGSSQSTSLPAVDDEEEEEEVEEEEEEEEEEEDDSDSDDDDEFSDSDSDSDDEFEEDDEEEDEEEEGIPVTTALPSASTSSPTSPVLVPRTDYFDTVTLAANELSEQCLDSLHYPGFVLDNTKREDIVFICFQFWVLGMSIVAILTESIPHIIASCITHLMATAWAAVQIVHTTNFKDNYHRAVIDGACEGTALIPHYWDARSKAEYPTLVLNVVALFVSLFLTWKLMKTFGWQTFKRMGASLTINRAYHMLLALYTLLQLAFFFMIITVSLWLDNLFNGVAADVALAPTLYKVTAFLILFMLPIWVLMGWYGATKERRGWLFTFLVLSVVYMVSWATMFLSHTFRWTFINWRFYTVMASASILLTVVALVLGILCRINFGKGLITPDTDSYSKHSRNSSKEGLVSPYTVFDDEEKVAFPERRTDRFLRTFSKVFPVRQQAPVPTFTQVVPSMPSNAFFGDGRPHEKGKLPDLPLARPGFKELVLRSNTASTKRTSYSSFDTASIKRSSYGT